jgi:hypothetical protein
MGAEPSMKAETMNEKTIELPPLPESEFCAWMQDDRVMNAFPWGVGDPAKWDHDGHWAAKRFRREPLFTANQMHAYVLADRASRSRAASEPGEVARLAEEARDLLLEALSAAESAGHPLNHGRSADANKARDELLAIIARLASAATSPASEALTPQQREDILVKAGAICDGGMSHDDFGLEIIDQVERHYGICAHGAGSISKS